MSDSHADAAHREHDDQLSAAAYLASLGVPELAADVLGRHQTTHPPIRDQVACSCGAWHGQPWAHPAHLAEALAEANLLRGQISP